jgi:hypothetical protein
VKIVSPALKAHMKSEVTTMASCLSITRKDGKTFFFTDHDEPLVIGPATYIPYHSYVRTSVPTSIDLDVDTLEIQGILNSKAIKREDIAAGLFDAATVDMFVVNYKAPNTGRILLRRGWIGEIATKEDQTYQAEIRGLTQVLSTRVGDAYTPECRADLGDKRCGYTLMPKSWEPAQFYLSGTKIVAPTVTAENYHTITVQNASFEVGASGSVVTAPTGWTAYGEPDLKWQITPNVAGVSPRTGGLFIVQSSLTAATGGLTTSLNLIAQGLDPANLDTGLCRLYLDVFIASFSDGAQGQVRVYAYDAQNRMIGVIADTGAKTYGRGRWVLENVPNALIPANTRFLRLDLSGTKAPAQQYGVGFDGIRCIINDPEGNFGSSSQYGSVMFEAVVGGASGNFAPNFAAKANIGDTLTDGQVTWIAIASTQTWSTVEAVELGARNFVCTGGIIADEGYYAGGLLVWETGRNAGKAVEVKASSLLNVELFQRSFYPIQIGDRFRIYPGCDKRFQTCLDKFRNAINFRGEPFVPGQDSYYKTPNAPKDE